MNRLSRAGITVVLLVGALWAGGVAEARRLPNAVTVCVDSSSGVVRRVASSSVCAGGTQFGRHQNLHRCCVGMLHRWCG